MAIEQYCTSFCNHSHHLSNGRPIGHECYVIPPALLRAERDLGAEAALVVWSPWYARKGPTVRGCAIREEC